MFSTKNCQNDRKEEGRTQKARLRHSRANYPYKDNLLDKISKFWKFSFLSYNPRNEPPSVVGARLNCNAYDCAYCAFKCDNCKYQNIQSKQIHFHFKHLINSISFEDASEQPYVFKN